MTLTTLVPPSRPIPDWAAVPAILEPLRPCVGPVAAGDADEGEKKAPDTTEGTEREDDDTGFDDDDLGFDGGFAPAEIEEFDEADFDDDFDDDFEEELDEDDLGDDDDNGVTETNDDDDFDDEE